MSSPMRPYHPTQQFLHLTVSPSRRLVRYSVGEVYSLAFEAVGRAKHDAVVVFEDREVLKAIVGDPYCFASILEVCADLDIELELHSAAEGGRCKSIEDQYWQDSLTSNAEVRGKRSHVHCVVAVSQTSKDPSEWVIPKSTMASGVWKSLAPGCMSLKNIRALLASDPRLQSRR
jgi:hypothetical protein